MKSSRYLALLSMIAAGARAPLAAFPTLLKRTPKERKPHPKMVTAPAEEIHAWNKGVDAVKREKKLAKIERRRLAAMQLGVENAQLGTLRRLAAAIKQRMSDLAAAPKPAAD